MSNINVDRRLLMPVLAGFFIMGFCDIVAPISGRIAMEFPMQQGAVSFLPTMVFLWFLILSVPVASLMNRIGRKRTALLGYAFTVVGLMIPYAGGEEATLGWYFAGFGLLGVGNTVVQVAVNPLLATIVPGARMTSYLTIGQIFRNSSLLLLAPIVTTLLALTDSWRLLLPIYAALTVVGGVWLQLTTVPEPKGERATGFVDCFRLLKNRTVLICTLGIASFIAADVGIGFVSVRLFLDNPNSILITTGFYACRIVGTLVGAFVLVRYADSKYLKCNMVAAVMCAVMLVCTDGEVWDYTIVGVLGFCMSCVFATFYAAATKAIPESSNGVAGLMILAISAGAVSGPLCEGIIATTGAVDMGMLFVVACVGYMLWASFQLKNNSIK